jgi:hypothetical protein
MAYSQRIDVARVFHDIKIGYVRCLWSLCRCSRDGAIRFGVQNLPRVRSTTAFERAGANCWFSKNGAMDRSHELSVAQSAIAVRPLTHDVYAFLTLATQGGEERVALPSRATRKSSTS